MKSKQDDFGYWAGWVVAFTIAAAFFVYVVWQAPSLKSIACTTDETDCFRQWVAALGGWAALVVAAPTLLFLARQVQITEHHHQINTAIAHRQKRDLAKNLVTYCTVLDEIVHEKMKAVEDEVSPLKRDEAVKLLDHLARLLGKSNFRRFEDEIHVPVIAVDFLEERILTARDTFSKFKSPGPLKDASKKKTREIVVATQQYSGRIKAAGERFLEETTEFEYRLQIDDAI
ncbi:hypothetical protein [Agrobacterium tumefaciens]|jgi:hypothetical protein|uniref:hypothetical protein n=1 Tax=Agrobacterium tumefaciens TaxID=358 RepID=UPI000DCFCA7D|nr:hypothetical protein FY143_00710 [Agrobacterium tumefaciens]UXT80051.1 hypothetical protein FY131_00710 [Agrobacterium tumefaciens]